jgi:hypothetical protein
MARPFALPGPLLAVALALPAGVAASAATRITPPVYTVAEVHAARAGRATPPGWHTPSHLPAAAPLVTARTRHLASDQQEPGGLVAARSAQDAAPASCTGLARTACTPSPPL